MKKQIPFLSILLLSFCLFSQALFAKTRVAFLELYDAKGRLIQYVPGGRFGHSAIQVEGKWLNAYPREGVSFVSWEELNHRGRVAAIVEIPQTVTLKDVAPYLGKPFDFKYGWGDDALYCSELISKLLGVQPEPMVLNHEVWPKSYWPLEGTPGMSPDRLYEILRGPGPYYSH